jgi:hypothetical protein
VVEGGMGGDGDMVVHTGAWRDNYPRSGGSWGHGSRDLDLALIAWREPKGFLK